jgi:hypothetical protein
LVKTAAATRAHGGKGSHIRPLKSIIRDVENFRRWIWGKGVVALQALLSYYASLVSWPDLKELVYENK